VLEEVPAHGFFSDLSRLGFTLTETDNSLEIDLVDHVEYDLESSLVVLGFLPIFLESDNDLGLCVSLFEDREIRSLPCQTRLRGI
jgi:hypothetical protein